MALYVIPVPAPVAGTDWQYTVPGQYLEHITGITATLDTGYTVGTIMVDSSGEGNDGTYLPFPGPTLTAIPAGLVAGNGAIQIDNTAGYVGTAPCEAGADTQDFFACVWMQSSRAASIGQAVIELTNATDIALTFIVGDAQMTLLRRWGAGPGDIDLVAPAGTFDRSSGIHMLAVSYDSGADLYRFYFDGAPFGTPVAGTGHPTGVPIVTALVGQADATADTTYDEIMWGILVPSDADVAGLYAAAAVDFPTYVATALAIGPDNYYHLDNFTPNGGAQVTLDVTNGTHTTLEMPTGFPDATGGGPFRYSWQPNLNSSSQTPDGTVTTVAIPDLILPAGYTVGTRTLDLPPGGQWSDIFIWWDSGYMDALDPLNAYVFPGGIRLVYQQERP